MKKFGVFSAVLILLLSTGYPVWQFVRVKAHKYEMKKELKRLLKSQSSDENTVTFSEFDLKEAKWEHSKEFFLGEEKYDVVRKKVQNGETVYVCVNDKVEKKLLRQMHKQRQKQGVKDDNLLKKLNWLSAANSIRDKSYALQSAPLCTTFNHSFLCEGFLRENLRPPGV